MIVRFPFPRLITIQGQFFIAFSYSVSDFMGCDTIISYAILTRKGIKRIWAF